MSALFKSRFGICLHLFHYEHLYRCSDLFIKGGSKKQLQDHFRHAINIKLIPKASVLKWGVFIETKDDFLFGTYYLNSFSVEHVSTKNKQYVDLIENSSKHPIVIDFLASTNYAFPFVEKKKNGYLFIGKI